MFLDMLKTQLLLKNVVTPEDWTSMSEHIQFDYIYDNHFAELKDSELFQERINNAAQAEQYIGKYFSQDYVRRKILRQTDEEIVEQDQLIAAEIEAGLYPDPLMMQSMELAGAAVDLQNKSQPSTQDPGIDEKAVEAPEGGEI